MARDFGDEAAKWIAKFLENENLRLVHFIESNNRLTIETENNRRQGNLQISQDDKVTLFIDASYQFSFCTYFYWSYFYKDILYSFCIELLFYFFSQTELYWNIWWSMMKKIDHYDTFWNILVWFLLLTSFVVHYVFDWDFLKFVHGFPFFLSSK